MKTGLEGQGLSIPEIFINIDELERWCTKRKVKNTGSNRSKYVAELAKKF